MRLFVWGWSFLEADFLSHYGIDLYEFVHKESARRFITLVMGLPSESSFFRFVRDKDNYSLPSLLT